MPTWYFKTAIQRTRYTATQQWYWQIDTQHSVIAITSQRLFATLADCIADARENGFRGEVEIPASLAHPAMITCQEGDYVHAIVERSMRERAVYYAS